MFLDPHVGWFKKMSRTAKKSQRVSRRHLWSMLPFLEMLEDRTVLSFPIRPMPIFSNAGIGLTHRNPGTFTPNPTVHYQGGPLLQNVQIRGVYFTPTTGTQYTDRVTGLALRSQLDAFFTDITNSSWMNQELNTWSVPAGTYNPPGGVGPVTSPGYTISTGGAAFVGDDILSATYSESSTISDTTIQNLLNAEVVAGRLPDDTISSPTHLEVVFTPGGVEVDAGGGATSVNAFLGYHSAFIDSFGKLVVYAVMPYQGPAFDGAVGPDGPNAEVGAEARSFTLVPPNPLTVFQDLTAVTAHEVAEAITDPIPDNGFLGWLDTADPSGGLFPGGLENADLTNAELSTYHGFVMQELPSRSATDLANQHGGPSAVATATGPVITPLDTDFFITQVDNPTATIGGIGFNGTIATFFDKDGAGEPVSNFIVGINWSDGFANTSVDGTGNVTIVSNGDGTFNIIGKHTYLSSDPVGFTFGSNPFNFDGLHVFVTDTTNHEAAWNKPPVALVATELANVTGITSTTASGTYGTGALITLGIDFNEAVNVTGTPQLALNSGGTAFYTSGSGTAHLTFTYTVAAGQTTSGNSLDASSINALTGTIKDLLGNNAILTVPIALAPNSLPGSKSIIINASVAAPIVTGVSPTSGPTTGGTSVTITGSNFTGATAVNFGSTVVTTFSVGGGGTSITVTSPAHAAGTVDVTVTTPGGTSATSSADQFTYFAAPTITGISPTGGPIAGGTSVTITGTNFTGATAVNFGSTVVTTFTVGGGGTTITVASPAHAAGTVDVTVTNPGGTSATSGADQFTFFAAPTVTGVSPTGGPIAGGTSVTITGSNFTGATAVNFGSTVVTTFSVGGGGTSLTVASPAHAAGTVDVTVTTPGGTSATSSADQFTYFAVPTVTGISPSSGPTAGGTSVTITGSNFTGATAVNFGSSVVTTFTVGGGGTSITVTSPAHAAGTVDVTVTTPGGTSATSSADQFTYTSAPIVTGISPTGGPIAGGTTVTITGSNFTGATAVNFGSTIVTTFTVGGGGTSITVASPAHAAGTVDVTVTTPGGTSATSSADQFTFFAVPTVTGVSPTSGPIAGGTTVTITGSNFTGATAVIFGSTVVTTFTVGGGGTSILVTSPAHATGTVDVTVTTPGGTSATSSADQFTYFAAPTVTGVSPTGGPIAGGTTVTITGSNFTGATAVNFGSTIVTTFTVGGGGTSITVASPAHAAGTVDVTVTTPGGTSATSSADQFTYFAVPTVTGISPSSGPIAGGTSVTITGSNFTGATAVNFGSTVVSTFTVGGGGTTITVTSPAHTAGTVDVTVTTPGGTSATSSADQFTFTSAPIVTGISPSSGPIAGGTTVTITGSNFTGATAVNFGSTVVTTFTVGGGGTTITVASPAHAAGTVDVTVTTPGGTSTTSSADQFTFFATPTVTGISPTGGPTAGGTTVTITGTNFTGATAVSFGSTVVTTFSVGGGGTSITVTSPAHAAGTVDVTVTNPGGTSATSGADQFTYFAAPTVTGLSPTGGPIAGGTTVTITGSNFTGATAVNFGSTVVTTFSVGGGGTSLTVASPAHAAGTVDVTVTTPGGTSATSSADQFTFFAVPTVTSIAPSTGPTAGGTSVTITGSNFTGATAVNFGSSVVTTFTVGGGGTSITVTSPAHAAGTVDVTVTTPGGTSATSSADQFTYTSAPIVTGISPTGGPIAGGTTVTITGSNFTGATAVNFGSTIVTTFTVGGGGTSITVASPAHAAGTVDITVTTPGGTSAPTSADQFTYFAVPTVTGISPSSGPGGGGTSVTITGANFTGATAVQFGSTVVTTFTVNGSGTSITVTSPAHAAGTVDVTVVTPGGTSATSAADQFTFAAPTVVAYRVLFGSQSYDLVANSLHRIRLPWQITGIQVLFSETITAGDINSLTGLPSFSGFSGLGTNTLTWTFSVSTPLQIGSFMTLLQGSGADALKDAGGNGLSGGSGFAQNFKVLLGDNNDDGVVTISDAVLANTARSNPYSILYDVNGDGVIDLTDVNIIRNRIGTSQP